MKHSVVCMLKNVLKIERGSETFEKLKNFLIIELMKERWQFEEIKF